MVDQHQRRPWTLGREVLSTAQHLAVLAGRPLRRKAVLFVILAISVIWCVLSLVHIHLVSRPSRLRVSAKTSGDEYDVNSLLDSNDGLKEMVLPPPPNFPRDPQNSQPLPSSHDEFSLLKRQHKLKEGELEGQADHHNHHHQHNHHSDRPSADSLDAILGGSSASVVGGIKCRNSLQGKYLIADDRGYVCPRRAVGINGCCATDSVNSSSTFNQTQLYSCDTCDTPTGCCASYEHCISCCMAPQHRQLLNRMVAEKKSAVFRIFIANISDYFELCLTKCRTFSGSVQHENTYRNAAAKHCFSDLGL